MYATLAVHTTSKPQLLLSDFAGFLWHGLHNMYGTSTLCNFHLSYLQECHWVDNPTYVRGITVNMWYIERTLRPQLLDLLVCVASYKKYIYLRYPLNPSATLCIRILCMLVDQSPYLGYMVMFHELSNEFAMHDCTRLYFPFHVLGLCN